MISIKRQKKPLGEKMKKNKLLLLLLIAGIITLLIMGRAPITIGEEENNELTLFQEVYKAIKNHYIEKVDSSKLIEAAIEGMIKSLEDPHSRWMNSKAYQEMEIKRKGELGGLGITITIKDYFPVVVSVIENTPARKAGIKPEDKIIQINGESTKGISLEEAATKLRGKPGTTVQITIQREKKKEPIIFTITRAIYKIPNIKWRLIEDIGYLKIISFMDKNTDKDVKEYLKELKKRKISSLILDLRDNSGGSLNQAIKVADEFLPLRRMIVFTKGRESGENKIYYSYEGGEAENIPLVVLINEGSASASEIVAGAIKEHQRGILIGTKTFGKGTVQWLFPVNGQGALSLTIAKYYTPSGKCIEGIGIEPDIKVEAFKADEKENEIMEKLRKSRLIEEFLNQHPHWEKENLDYLLEDLKKEENIEVEKSLLERILREKDDNEENDIFNDLQLIFAVKLLNSYKIFEKYRVLK